MAKLHNNSRAARAQGSKKTLSPKQADELGETAFRQTIVSSAIEGKYTSRKSPLAEDRGINRTR